MPGPDDRSDPSHQYAKGDAVWYKQRDGSWAPAKVVSVDKSIDPPSLGIELAEGHWRETEAHRLRPRGSTATHAGGTLVHAGLGAGAGLAGGAAGLSTAAAVDDFGDFAAAEAKPAALPMDSFGDFAAAAAAAAEVKPAALPMDSFGDFAAAAAAEAKPTALPMDSFGDFAAAAAEVKPAALPMDDFGDFAAAAVVKPASQEATQRAAPLPLTLFGEEDSELVNAPLPQLPPLSTIHSREPSASAPSPLGKASLAASNIGPLMPQQKNSVSLANAGVRAVLTLRVDQCIMCVDHGVQPPQCRHWARVP